MNFPSHDAVLLSGGASSRMGTDKALLEVNGKPLWKRQWTTLGLTRPGRMWISLSADAPVPSTHTPVLRDPAPGIGPFGGLLAALRAVEADLLLVLAVDLPRMTAEYLYELLRCCGTGRGCVPVRGDRFEPLAAVYPRGAVRIAERRLREERYALQELVAEGLSDGLFVPHEIADTQTGLFENLNTPDDWRRFAGPNHE